MGEERALVAGLTVGSCNMRIRDAQPADASQLSELLTQLGYPVAPEEAAGRLAHAGERVLVADDAGWLLGLVAVCVQAMLVHPGPTARVTALVVRADARGTGVGHRLMAAATAHARAQGCDGVELTSAIRPERDVAHRFYQRLGFSRTSYRYWLGLDASAH